MQAGVYALHYSLDYILLLLDFNFVRTDEKCEPNGVEWDEISCIEGHRQPVFPFVVMLFI